MVNSLFLPREKLERDIIEIETENERDKDPKSLWGCTNDHRKVQTATNIEERDIYERPNKEKLQIAQDFKNEANKAYKAKDYDKSAFMYKKVR